MNMIEALKKEQGIQEKDKPASNYKHSTCHKVRLSTQSLSEPELELELELELLLLCLSFLCFLSFFPFSPFLSFLFFLSSLLWAISQPQHTLPY